MIFCGTKDSHAMATLWLLIGHIVNHERAIFCPYKHETLQKSVFNYIKKKKQKKKKNSTIRNHVTAKFPCYPRSHHSWLTINHERLTWHVDHSFQRIYLEHFDNLSSVCSEYGSLNQPTSWLILVDERITLISLINWLAEAFTTNLLTNQIPYQRFSYNIVWRSLKGVEFSRNDFEGWRKEFNR